MEENEEKKMKNFSDRVFTDISKDNARIVDCEFVDCVFEKCRFTDCTFVDCSFCECTFNDCTITNITSKGTNMVFATFVNCTIVGVEWLTLQSNSVSLPIQKFDKCYLKYNSFEKNEF